MNLHHDALVLVADGQKYLLLRNSGDFRKPVLKVEASAERNGAPTRDLGSDQPGRAFSSAGGTASAMEQTDWHQQAEDRFAAEAAALLARRAGGDDGTEIVVVAPPRTLAELRRHYSREVSARIVAEIDKDLTGHPVDEIAAIIIR
jgi:protein required for attachment to host cells